MCDYLTVDPCEVCGRTHRLEIALTLLRTERRARQLAIGQEDLVDITAVVHQAHKVGAGLVPEPARAGVYHYRGLSRKKPERRGPLLVEDALDLLDLDEMIPRADRAQLLGRALF